MASYCTNQNRQNKCESCLHCAKERKSVFTKIDFLKGESFSVKALNSAEILFVHKGRIQLRYNDSSSVLLIREGEMVLLSEKVGAVVNVLEDGLALFMKFDNYESICRSTLLDSSPSFNSSTTFLRPSQLCVADTLRSLSEVLINLIDEGVYCSYYQGLMRETVFFLFEVFYTKEQVINFFYPILTRGFKFKSFIYNNYKHVPTVNQLIELSKLSRASFYKIFMAEFGVSAKKWLVQQRMSLVVEKFKDESLSIKDVMFESGFDNHSQFTRFCKTNFGDIPSNLIHQLRKQVFFPCSVIGKQGC